MGEGENLTNIVKNKEKGEILFLLILLEHIYIERVELDTFLLYVQYDESYSIAAPGPAFVSLVLVEGEHVEGRAVFHDLVMDRLTVSPSPPKYSPSRHTRTRAHQVKKPRSRRRNGRSRRRTEHIPI